MTPDRNDKAQLIGTGSERVPTQSLVEEMRRGASRRAVSVESVADRTVLDSTGAADSGTALREQAEFNRSLVSVLKAITYELAGIEQQVGGWQADHARITSQAAEDTAELAGTLRALGTEVERLTSRAAKLEESLDRALAQLQEELRAQVDSALADMKSEVRAATESVGPLRSPLECLTPAVDQVVKRADDLAHQLAGLDARARDETAELKRVTRAWMDEAEAQFATEGARAGQALQGLAEVRDELTHRLDELRMRTIRAERRATSTNEDSEKLPFDYFLFEHEFRGPIAEIKQRQAIYLEFFQGRRHVLDIGCGRGEFVELLAEHGINVTGVDVNPDMVAFCQDRGLRSVEMADMFGYLKGLPDASLDGAFVAQVVEHIEPARIARLISLNAQKLSPGGIIVLETPNPACPTALGNFYVDPTHVRPVPARLLRYLLEQGPFKVGTIRFSAPTSQSAAPAVLDVTDGSLPSETALYQDYAVIAIRR